MDLKTYRLMLIKDILNLQTKSQYTREELLKKPIRILEHIYDYID